ncbi:MAG TPA: SBBP repeat-containing protein [Terriglobales bacterium]|nr:SBBP repeat-containing protein [Terriglobales bacterium]
MPSFRLVFAVTILLSTLGLAQSVSPAHSALVSKDAALSQPDPAAQARVVADYGRLPLAFEANHGQTDAQVKFLSRTSAYSLFLTGDEAVLTLNAKKTNAGSKDSSSDFVFAHRVLRMKLRNANAAKLTGIDEQAATTNYFLGNDPAKWRTNVPTYAKVKYENIYNGIDLVYYGNQRQLEYDFIVAPAANPRSIAFNITGANTIRQDAHGDLVFKMGDEEIRWHKPIVYQEKNGIREEIAAHYTITDKTRVGFELAKYDATKPLYIDPLIYSTYLGGSGGDVGLAIAVDSAGNAYVTGFTRSTDFPVTSGALQTNADCSVNGCANAFVSKINPSGTALVYSTYLGGGVGAQGTSIAVDSTGNVYVTGLAGANFPLVNPLQPTYGGNFDAFVSKINPSGSALVYSTYLGGSGQDLGFGIAVDSAGNAYVTGNTGSPNFPTTPNAFQTVCNGGGSPCGNPNRDAFVAKINPKGSALVYSTYLGGSGDESGDGIAVDNAGNAYITGFTGSTNFPTKSPLQPGNHGTYVGCPCNAFVTKLNFSGSALVYSTYLGGSNNDSGLGIAVDSAGDAYVAGFAGSGDFPTMNAWQPTLGSGLNAFVSKIDPSGSAFVYSTYLGGNDHDFAQGIATDSKGNAYVIGIALSTNFPTMNPVQPVNAGAGDAFVTAFNSTGSALLYSTYLGGTNADIGYGIAVDSSGSAYATGTTNSSNFPGISPLQPANGGSANAFVAKITADVTLTPQIVSFGSQLVGTTSVPQISKLTNTGRVTLSITSIGVTGANSGDFAQTNNCGTSLPVGDSCNITVTFAPTALATRIATVTIKDNGQDGPHTIGLNGVGTSTTTTTLTSSPNPSGLHQSVTLTAVVTPTQSGTPTGTITFYDGTTALGTVALSLDKAVLKFAKLSTGSHSLTAAYSGDSVFQPSTSPVVIQVVKIRTTVKLASSLNPSVFGQSVTFSATVASSIGAPPNGETVTFRKGSKVLGTGTLSGGIASLTTSTLPVGTDAILAVYGGDSNFLGSTSNTVQQVVNNAAE